MMILAVIAYNLLMAAFDDDWIGELLDVNEEDNG